MNCKLFNYADDTQLILGISNYVQSQGNVQNILHFIVHWMTSNWLKVNPEKTKVMIVASKGCLWSERY